MELEVQEHLEPPVFELADDGRPLGIEQRHTDLEPDGVTRQRIGELESTVSIAIDRDDDSVASLSI